jgi:hypothetical protein
MEKINFVHPTSEKIQIKSKLDELQKYIEDQYITPQLQREEFNLQCHYQQALKKEEELWHLKSRSLWLHDGDKNTIFFIIKLNSEK